MAVGDAMPDRISVANTQQDGWSVTTVAGELDIFTAPALESQLLPLIGTQATEQYAIDLAGVEFCDSAGLNAFIRAWKRALAMGCRLILVRPSRRVVDLLRITGVDQAIEVLDSLPPAITLSGEAAVNTPKTPPAGASDSGKPDPVA
ncbi:STAS domain-containing protein [Actinomadura livida]|uniref:Anti-sigma factor antagonist n=1 Tax=Actinomadura livida TaxID=79909 RepID=A0A7W7MWK9_9ACTN|nr:MULTISPECIES: STAS domain-containing protein [Actinomadura]MBB4772925.1 anti-anti-sigma factor [Actinomadura catellatispora]GGU13709.1 anti-sigma factor antagonist [Actinomadura livida]